MHHAVNYLNRLFVGVAVAAIGVAPASAQDGDGAIGGRWELTAAGRGTATLVIGTTDVPSVPPILVDLARLEGLHAEQLGDGSTLWFVLQREAGRFEFNGQGDRAGASGWYRYIPAARYADALVHRGLRAPTPEEQLALAREGVTLQWIDELLFISGELPEIRELVHVAETGLTLEELQALRGTGRRHRVRELVGAGGSHMTPQSSALLRILFPAPEPEGEAAR